MSLALILPCVVEKPKLVRVVGSLKNLLAPSVAIHVATCSMLIHGVVRLSNVQPSCRHAQIQCVECRFAVCIVPCSEVERKRCSSNYSGRMGRLGVGEVGGAS